MATFFKRKATVVALAALSLTVAGGGVAIAAQPQAKAPQPAVRHATQQPPVTAAEQRAAKAALRATLAPPAPGTVAWAVVAQNGTLLQHSGNVVSSSKFAPGPGVFAGQYLVLLDYNVSAKSYHVSLGTNDSANVPPAGEVAAAPRTLTPTGVFVQTRSSSGGYSDRPFHIVIAN
ncbi:hypothetical protein GA0070622_5407 [Micromonospora sediminicola]|uniref:Secreted protein n=1 Tax=Micromonospora sediminicola TaxID=946078 RepID=A0A1A9BGK1_9ACTN|nr:MULTISPECIES: hypothetical protein [Micromonospora]PGH43067.1 hypothetical protein COO58_00350 [Micromonospora sp. WMMA1996]SBT68308.1 hypothetical protein GA0070622_5407 [Micromonospora sediminicola]